MTAASATLPADFAIGDRGPGSGTRLVGSLVAASLVATGLFLLLMTMVSNPSPTLEESVDLGGIQFIRLDREDERLRTKDRQQPPEEPPPPDQPPPPSAQPLANVPAPEAPLPQLDIPNIQSSINTNIEVAPYLGNAAAETAPTTGPGAGALDGEIAAIVRVPPVYPRTAKLAGIEGYVTLEFTVQPDGSVSDMVIINAEPPVLFNEAAKEALRNWRFQPRRQGGQAVAAKARQTIRFNLE